MTDKKNEIDSYEKQLGNTREIGDRGSEATALGNLGKAYTCLGRYEDALRCFNQALEKGPYYAAACITMHYRTMNSAIGGRQRNPTSSSLRSPRHSMQIKSNTRTNVCGN